MRIRIGRPSPAIVISGLALVVAMGGTGYAAATIGSGQIKDNSILSRDVHNGTLTGKDIRESSLSKVPRAAKVANFVTFNVAMRNGDARTLLTKAGPVSLYGTCVDDPNTSGNLLGSVTAETSAPHTYTYNDEDLTPGNVSDIADNSGLPNVGDFSNYESYEPMFFSGVRGGSFDYDGESAGIIIGGPGADCRFVGSLPLFPAS